MSTRAGPTAALLDELRAKIIPVLRPYASRIELFGSFARGEQRPDSDIDLLVKLRPGEHRPPLDLFDWFALEEEVGRQFGHRAEIATEEDLSRHVRPYIEPDRIVLYEE